MITVHRREGADGFVAGNFGAGQFRGLIKLDTDCFVAVPRSRERRRPVLEGVAELYGVFRNSQLRGVFRKHGTLSCFLLKRFAGTAEEVLGDDEIRFRGGN